MIDTLALFALKVAPNVFDLSSGLAHVSMRDQVVRARLLVRDLHGCGEPCIRLLIVGAGLAGISAAMAAAELGIEATVVDTKQHPMSLQSHVSSRFVGPFMYEWPASFHDKQDYPPRDPALWPSQTGYVPTWSSKAPLRASELAAEVQEWLTGQLVAGKLLGEVVPRFVMDVDPVPLKKYLTKQFKPKGSMPAPIEGILWPSKAKHSSTLLPDFVILAAGMGPERVALNTDVSGPAFWSNDTLAGAAPEDRLVGVFGGGDGALQDVLRVVTRFDHPLEFIAELEKIPDVKVRLEDAARALSAIAQQHELVGAWTISSDIFLEVDRKCQGVAKTMATHASVRTTVDECLKTGSGVVHLFMKNANFSKAYMLNRFAVHLIEQCQGTAGSGRVRLEVHRDSKVVAAAMVGSDVEVSFRKHRARTVKTLLLADVSVRYGVDAKKAGGRQIVALTKNVKESRTMLAQVPLPFAV